MHCKISLIIFVLQAQKILAQSALNTSQLSAVFAPGSEVLQSLRPTSELDFDFSPSDYFQYRNASGQYHTGDLTLRYRTVGSDAWVDDSTAIIRNVSVQGTLDSSLSPILSNAASSLNVSRSWSDLDGDLALQFTITNINSQPVEVGSLGLPIEFNNIFVNRTAVETTNKCVLIDPYIGLHAGYVQATRLTGTGPNLVITPLGNTTKFEAWRFLREPHGGPLGYQIQTYEGNYEWQVFTKAYAELEWNATTPWNTPTSQVLAPDESITVGLRFSLAAGVSDIESTVAAKDVPVAVGIPGYVLTPELNGKLYVNSTSAITSMTATPPSALQVQNDGLINGWQCLNVQSNNGTFGRARLDITFSDSRTMAVHYYLSDSGPSALGTFGNFLTTDQWYTDTSDPFHRAPSVITYDNSTQDYVLQDNRTWIAGLSDEGGAGSFLAAALKQAVQPAASEIGKLEEMVQKVVWGELQLANGSDQYAVRKSLFYYQPDLVPGYEYSDAFNWTVNPGESWNRAAAYQINRAYDYVHVSSLYWSLYRAGTSYPGILKQQTAEWYLQQAYQTIIAVFAKNATGAPKTAYYDVGLMGETVWGSVLSALIAENHMAEAANLTSILHARQQAWAAQPDPYGSEMAWDSTGQEGVYYWSAYFADNSTAQKTIESIRGFMPTVPHWGWNGNARRYWDFLYAGKLPRIERQIHHYGSGLNALPLLQNYRAAEDPQSMQAIYDLRVGYGGIQGSGSNIDQNGFGSMAFHSYPEALFWDSYTGDYGPNFVGHVLGSATYLVEHPVFGWISFGGNVEVGADGANVTVLPRDSVRQKVFVAPLGLYVAIDAGMIESFTYDRGSGGLSLVVSPSAGSLTAPSTVLSVEQSGNGTAIAPQGLSTTAGGYLVDFRGSCDSQTISFE